MARKKGVATTEGHYGRFERKPSKFESKRERGRGTRTRNKRGKKRY